MCIGAVGKVLSVNNKSVVVIVNKQRKEIVNNPALKVKKGDKVVVFKNFIIEKIS